MWCPRYVMHGGQAYRRDSPSASNPCVSEDTASSLRPSDRAIETLDLDLRLLVEAVQALAVLYD